MAKKAKGNDKSSSKRETKNHTPSKKWSKYKVEGGKVSRSPSCPKCGQGVFLGIHKDRKHCGSCSYVEYTKQ